MKNWQKDRNYRKFKNEDGSFRYVITVEGEEIEVDARLYEEYAKIGRKMEYSESALKRDRYLRGKDGKLVRDGNGQAIKMPEREISLDKLIGEDWEFPSETPSPEEICIANEFSESEELRRCIGLLSEYEQLLINEIFFVGLTQTQLAKKLNKSQQTVSRHLNDTLAKIKKLWIFE